MSMVANYGLYRPPHRGGTDYSRATFSHEADDMERRPQPCVTDPLTVANGCKLPAGTLITYPRHELAFAYEPGHARS